MEEEEAEEEDQEEHQLISEEVLMKVLQTHPRCIVLLLLPEA